MKPLGNKELAVLAHLRKNARMRLTKLSRLTQIPVSTLYDKLKRDYGLIIKKFTVLVDFSALHFAARVKIILKVKKQHKFKLQCYLKQHGNVNSLYKINNGYDFMAEVIFPKLKQFEQFIDYLEAHFTILELQTYHVIEDLKREAFLSNPVHLETTAYRSRANLRKLYKSSEVPENYGGSSKHHKRNNQDQDPEKDQE